MKFPVPKGFGLLPVFLMFFTLMFPFVGNAQTAPGDIAFVAFQSDNPDKFSFIALKNLPANAQISFTDNGWLNTGAFRSGEGHLLYTVPSSGIDAGTLLTIDLDVAPTANIGAVVKSGGTFSLAANADQILAYTGDATSPNIIAAIHFGGDTWDADATSANTSAIPAGLSNGLNCLAVGDVDNARVADNWTTVYDNPGMLLNDAQNWETSSSPQTWGNWPIEVRSLTQHENGDYTNSNLLFISPEARLLIDGIFDNQGLVVINSNETRTGALFCYNVDVPRICILRHISDNRWQYLGPSLFPSQTRHQWVQSPTNLISHGDGTVLPASTYAMMFYDTQNNDWFPFEDLVSGSDQAFGFSTGFAVRREEAGQVYFYGSAQNGTVILPVSDAGYGWNCLANPFTCPVGAVSGSEATETFMDYNSSDIPVTHRLVYVWNGTEYEPVSAAATFKNIQANQGFMVCVNPGVSSLTFTDQMKVDVNPVLKAGEEDGWKRIKIQAKQKEEVATTYLAFHEDMSPGLDPSFDGGAVAGKRDLQLYSKLLQGYPEVKFAIQALPPDFTGEMKIPIYLVANNGGPVLLEISGLHQFENCRLYLNDIKSGQKNELLSDTVGIQFNLDAADLTRQLQFCMQAVTTPANKQEIMPLEVVSPGNRAEVRGLMSGNCTLRLYDTSGRLVLLQQSKGACKVQLNEDLNRGCYLLQVQNSQYVQSIFFIIP